MDTSLLGGRFRANLTTFRYNTQMASGTEARRTLIARFGGEPGEKTRHHLVLGDNARSMDALKDRWGGRVQLIYADPPFASGKDYHRAVHLDGTLDGPGSFEIQQYGDRWKLPSYLRFMRSRIQQMHDLLAPTGLLFLHLGGPAAAPVRLLCDEIFGPQRLINEVVWVRQHAHNDRRQGARHLGRIHDMIYVYGRSNKAVLRPVYRPYDPEYIRRFYRHEEAGSGRRYMLDNLVAPGGAAKGNAHYEFLGVTRYWRYSLEKMQQLYDDGRVIQTAPGRVPRYVRYLDEMPGRAVQDVWDDVPSVQVHARERTGFPTQKPLSLLERIVGLATDPGDLVLDPFMGSGTTMVAANQLGRRCLGLDSEPAALWLTLRRLIAAGSCGVTAVERSGDATLWHSKNNPELQICPGAEDRTLRIKKFAPGELLARLASSGEDRPQDERSLIDQLHVATDFEEGRPHFTWHALPGPGESAPAEVAVRAGAVRAEVVVVDRTRAAFHRCLDEFTLRPQPH